MNTITAMRQKCQYTILENGVHEFIMMEFSRSGVDAFIEALREMYSRVPYGISRPILVDSSKGLQPISYLFAELRTVIRLQPGENPSKVSVIMPSGIIAGIVAELVRIFPHLHVRIFKPEERRQAFEWLLSV